MRLGLELRLPRWAGASRAFQRRWKGAAYALLAEQDRFILWAPVLFGAGAALYLALRVEPVGWHVAVLLALLVSGSFVSRHRGVLLVALAAATVLALGFAGAKLRTEFAAAPTLPDRPRAYDVSGWIEQREQRDGGQVRLTLRVIALGLDASQTPFRVRVTARGTQAGTFSAGDAISVRAVLRAPPGPVMPGGYDFARAAYFDRIGGIGFAVAPAAAIDPAPDRPLSIAVLEPVESLRAIIGGRVLAAVPGESGDIAKALINGDRAGISEASNQAMRDSGLYHVISISGLHMVIVGGALFWLVRALLALSPALASAAPIKKIAAVAALGGALFYLLLSGGSVPTQRAWIMISIAFVAILLDRPAISQRTVALSALAILIVSPESIADVSFQMSFAAVVALVAFYEWQRDRRGPGDAPPRTLFWRMARNLALFVFGAALTTLIAGTAVTAFSIHHFQNAQHYAIVANVLASPVITGLIMPAALLAVIAMPLGVEAVPLQVMAFGIELMLAIAKMVASWPGAVSIVPKTAVAGLVLISLGGLWLSLWRGRMRRAGIAAIALGVAVSPLVRQPDVLIDREGKIVAVRGGDGLLAPTPARASNYAVSRWLSADGDARDVETAVEAGKAAHGCDDRGCIAQVGQRQIALVRHPAALEEDCGAAAVVVSPFPVSQFCAAPVVIDGRALRAYGAHALYLEGDKLRIETTAGLRGHRPWVSPPERARRTDLAIGHNAQRSTSLAAYKDPNLAVSSSAADQ